MIIVSKKYGLFEMFSAQNPLNLCLPFLWPLRKFDKLFMHYYSVAIKVRCSNKSLLQ